ncbi:unnamed protein product [Dibothriocephalus latus]|uniref:omega-amidase n=1 Tax=Dibothriocephalus latus TaxID=60516 RepID=A0A3P7NY43_DIBLA|nr:unnamed protein product [Dibothriocephalus latus]
MESAMSSDQVLRLSLAQLKVGMDKPTNITNAIALIEKCVNEDHAEMVVLPECFNSPYGTGFFSEYSEVVPGGNTCQEMAAVAKKHKIWLVAGSIPEKGSDDKLYNTSVVYNPEGEVVGTYRKAHLFDIDIPGMLLFCLSILWQFFGLPVLMHLVIDTAIYKYFFFATVFFTQMFPHYAFFTAGKISFHESDTLSPGSNFLSFKAKNKEGHEFTVGMGICYDMRFPELALIYARQHGCDLLIYPGAFNTTTGNPPLLSFCHLLTLCMWNFVALAPGRCRHAPFRGRCEKNTKYRVENQDNSGFGNCICFSLAMVGVYFTVKMYFIAHFPKCPLIFTSISTLPGPVHWELLARSRALDTQCYVAACSPAQDKSASYVSHAESLVVSPWGAVLANAGKDVSFGRESVVLL